MTILLISSCKVFEIKLRRSNSIGWKKLRKGFDNIAKLIYNVKTKYDELEIIRLDLEATKKKLSKINTYLEKLNRVGDADKLSQEGNGGTTRAQLGPFAYLSPDFQQEYCRRPNLKGSETCEEEKNGQLAKLEGIIETRD
jgi:hypothetical protein